MKVFPSSRQVKEQVGPHAWMILEDIALDADLAPQGRLVAETKLTCGKSPPTLDSGKNAVTRHLLKLRQYGLVFHEEIRQDGTGCYESSRCILDHNDAAVGGQVVAVGEGRHCLWGGARWTRRRRLAACRLTAHR